MAANRGSGYDDTDADDTDWLVMTERAAIVFLARP